MTCPTEIADALATILYKGIIGIRVGSDDTLYCAIESAHLRNLPNLMRDFSWAGLQEYLQEVETTYIPSFTACTGHEPYQALQAQWIVLRAVLKERENEA